MKTDREFLELAARAAGYKVRWHERWECFVHVNPHNISNPPTMAGQRQVWVPLDDDGDALRLAVKLQLMINIDIDGALVEMQVKDDNAWASEFAHDGDLYAATRRAIVRAAASIGEQMK